MGHIHNAGEVQLEQAVVHPRAEVRQRPGEALDLRHAHGDADEGAGYDGDQDRALDLQLHQHAGDDETQQAQQRRSGGGVPHVEGAHADGGRVVLNDDARVQQTDQRDEHADTGADSNTNILGDGAIDRFAQTQQGDEDEQHAGDEHDGQRLIIAIAVAQHDRIGKEGVQAHAGGLREGHLCVHGHQQRADERAQAGRHEYAAGNRAGHGRIAGNDIELVQDVRVDEDDVRHGKERGQAGHNFHLNGRPRGGHAKKLVQTAHLLLLCHR